MIPGLSGPAASLPGQLSQVTDLLTAMLALLDSLNGIIGSQGQDREEEIIVLPFSSDGPINVTSSVQLRVTSLDVYTAAAGLFQLQIGNDNSIKFLSTVNGKVNVVSGENQRVVVPRGLPVTIVPPSGAWYAILFARAGTARGRAS